MPRSLSSGARPARAALAIVCAGLPALTLVAAMSRASAQGGAAPAADLRTRASHVTGSLQGASPPRPQELDAFVKDRGALLRLGKALFWDQQLGSDGLACASCHYHAGADARSKNQLNPGFRNETAAFPAGDSLFGNSPLAPATLPPFAPNVQLTRADFPLHRLADPADARSALLSDTNDVVSSQGVFNGTYTGKKDRAEATMTGPGGVFQVDGALVRNVEPRNTPTVVNAIFNHRNFWDVRARSEFNGQNPIGELDAGATVLRAGAGAGGAPGLVAIAPRHLSTASQADGPPLSGLEMAFAGSAFPELGRKLLDPALVPLALQQVSPQDSALGALSRAGARKAAGGIAAGYADLVRQAFQPAWWDAGGFVVDLTAGAPAVRAAGKKDAGAAGVYGAMEYNFPLFFGLAIAEYERSLVADDTPFDRFMAGDDGALTPEQQRGLDLFIGKGRCVSCHAGAELTSASISNVARDGPLERMVMGDGRVAVYDTGVYNIGVRPTREDLGVGGRIGPRDLPLSDARRAQECVRAAVARGEDLAAANAGCGVAPIRARPGEAQLLLDRAALLLGNPPEATALLAQSRGVLDAAGADLAGAPGAVPPTAAELADAFAEQAHAVEAIAAAEAEAPHPPEVAAEVTTLVEAARTVMPDLARGGAADPLKPVGPPLGPDERIAADGAFKTPGLRNVELTAPYFHNGGQATLEQVVQFYDRGGDFADANRADLDPDIAPIGLAADEQAALVAFLRALTDERVRADRAPFDHPSLELPDGAGTGKGTKDAFQRTRLDDVRVTLPAVGAGGSATLLGAERTPFANFPDPLR